MYPENVTRAAKAWVRRKVLRIDDGRYYLIAKPEALSIDERTRIHLDELEHIPEATEFRWVPQKFRGQVVEILAGLNGAGETARAELHVFHTAFNKGLEDIRTARNQALENWCTRHRNILSRGSDVLSSSTTVHTTSPDLSAPKPPIPIGAGSNPFAGTPQPIGKFYEAGLGDGALAKLPPKPDRTVLLMLYDEVSPYASTDNIALTNLVTYCRRQQHDCTIDEIVHFIREKGPSARHKKSPMGFLLTAVPNCFAGESFLRYRAERRTAAEKAAAEEQRRAAAAEEHSRALEAEIALEEAVNSAWDQLPAAERPERQHQARRALETEQRFQRLTIHAQRAEVEARAKAALRGELQAQLKSVDAEVK